MEYHYYLIFDILDTSDWEYWRANFQYAIEELSLEIVDEQEQRSVIKVKQSYLQSVSEIKEKLLNGMMDRHEYRQLTESRNDPVNSTAQIKLIVVLADRITVSRGGQSLPF